MMSFKFSIHIMVSGSVLTVAERKVSYHRHYDWNKGISLSIQKPLYLQVFDLCGLSDPHEG